MGIDQGKPERRGQARKGWPELIRESNIWITGPDGLGLPLPFHPVDLL